GQALAVETRTHPLRRAVAGPGTEALDLDEKRSRAFHRRHDRGTAHPLCTLAQKELRRVRHRRQALRRHAEDADLVHAAEAVLAGPQHPVVQASRTLEIEYRVHDVLERLGPGNGPVLRNVAD